MTKKNCKKGGRGVVATLPQFDPIFLGPIKPYANKKKSKSWFLVGHALIWSPSRRNRGLEKRGLKKGGKEVAENLPQLNSIL